MATRTLLMVSTIRALSLPLVVLSYAIMLLKPNRLSKDLKHCLKVVDAAPNLPIRFVTTLISAEDHRNAFHPGVDPIAIFRVIYVWAQSGVIQGASTIEQQLVRVALGRYERTLRRKFWEQLLAIALSTKRPKARVAMAYLSKGFYGSGQHGISALKRYCGSNLNVTTQESVSRIIAQLKYPQPSSSAPEWQQKVNSRVRYITRRLLETDGHHQNKDALPDTRAFDHP